MSQLDNTQNGDKTQDADFDPVVLRNHTEFKKLTDEQRRQWYELELDQAKTGESDAEKEPTTWADMVSRLGPISWAWPGWLPNAMLTILAGESGAGKSALALRLAAGPLRRDPWPDGTLYTGEAGAILWCEAEAAQAINLERAKCWGLPLTRIITPLDDPLLDFKLDNPDHFNALTAKAYRDDIRLIVIDSLRGANSRDENSSDTMDMVKQLASLARDSGKPVLLTHHLRKRGVFDLDGVDLERLRGSSAIVQSARLVWALDTPDQQQKTWKRLQVVKSNLAKFPEAVGLTVNDTGVHFGLAPEAPKTETVTDRAAELLIALLQAGPMAASEIEEEYNAAGISRATITRAKAKLGIQSIKTKDGWMWGLPAKDGGYDN